MIHKVIVFFLVLGLNIEASIKEFPIFIGLGGDCQAATHLRNLKLRNEAYPFDWVVVQDLETIAEIFEDDFAHWMDPQYLVNLGPYIHNFYYNVYFPHDFPKDDSGTVGHNFLDFIGDVQEKYNRRIERLKKILESNKKVIFIRTYSTPQAANFFVNYIKNKYPNLKFVLLVVNGQYNYHNDEIGLYNYDWDIENVVNLYISDSAGFEGHRDWWWDKTWKKIFEEMINIKIK